jgi:hypothetical protein
MELMRLAFTIRDANSDGEHLAKLNPEFYRQAKTKLDEEAKVRDIVMKK